MKGHFSLNYCPYTSELQFGNLSEDLGTLGDINNALDKRSRIPMLIAHDVIEHAVNHRTNKYVTYEAELRAVGAIAFVRCSEGFDLWQEVLGQVINAHRPIKPVPYIVGKYLLGEYAVEVELMRWLVREHGINPACARNAVYQYAWGNYQKSQQFNDRDGDARMAFRFIEDNVTNAIKLLSWEDFDATGISIYFDTVKGIFRHQFKRAY